MSSGTHSQLQSNSPPSGQSRRTTRSRASLDQTANGKQRSRMTTSSELPGLLTRLLSDNTLHAVDLLPGLVNNAELHDSAENPHQAVDSLPGLSNGVELDTDHQESQRDFAHRHLPAVYGGESGAQNLSPDPLAGDNHHHQPPYQFGEEPDNWHPPARFQAAAISRDREAEARSSASSEGILPRDADRSWVHAGWVEPQSLEDWLNEQRLQPRERPQPDLPPIRNNHHEPPPASTSTAPPGPSLHDDFLAHLNQLRRDLSASLNRPFTSNDISEPEIRTTLSSPALRVSLMRLAFGRNRAALDPSISSQYPSPQGRENMTRVTEEMLQARNLTAEERRKLERTSNALKECGGQNDEQSEIS